MAIEAAKESMSWSCLQDVGDHGTDAVQRQPVDVGHSFRHLVTGRRATQHLQHFQHQSPILSAQISGNHSELRDWMATLRLPFYYLDSCFWYWKKN